MVGRGGEGEGERAIWRRKGKDLQVGMFFCLWPTSPFVLDSSLDRPLQISILLLGQICTGEEDDLYSVWLPDLHLLWM